jgi:hypothetical protein
MKLFKTILNHLLCVYVYPCSSVFIRGQYFFFILLSVVALGLSSCEGLARDIGMSQPTDLEQRTGLTGTQENPTPLDPFKRYELVMAAGECRYFTMQVPSKWYWKIYLTAANREDNRRGTLTAEILQANPPWSPLAATNFSKSFDLGREGLQAILAVGNRAPDRLAMFKLCQDGAPLHVTIQSEVSATNVLMGPTKKETGKTDKN